MKLHELEKLIEEIAPLELAMDWDNSGTTLAQHDNIERILVALDVTRDVLEEATSLKCDTILSHHPLVFHGFKRLDRQDPVGGLVLEAVRRGVNLYAAHTSCDCAPKGVNWHFAEQLGLKNLHILEPADQVDVYKLAVFAPVAAAALVKQAIFDAGAGELGNYRCVSFTTPGVGEFLPGKHAHPAIGTPGVPESVEEVRIECLCPRKRLNQVLSAILREHPYEEPAIDVYPLAYPNTQGGLGIIGDLDVKMDASSFASYVKAKLGAACVKWGGVNRPISRVAVVGGSAGEYFSLAAQLGADAFVTGEAKYNHFLDAKEQGILLVEAGHYDTEVCFVHFMAQGLQKRLDALQYKVSVMESRLGQRPYQAL